MHYLFAPGAGSEPDLESEYNEVFSFFLRDLPGRGRFALTSGPNREEIFDDILPFLGISSFDFSISVPDFDWKGSVLTSVASESWIIGLSVLG